MKLWLDAADATTFTFSSGSNVSGWRDKSGLSNNGTQLDTGLQPSYNSASTFVKFQRLTLNTGRYLSLPNNTLAIQNQPFSYFILFRPPSTLVGATQSMLVNDDNPRFSYGINRDSYVGMEGFSEPNLFASTIISFTTINFSELLYNGTTMFTATNFSTTESKVFGNRVQGGTLNRLGGGTGGYGYLEGSISEVLVYSTMLTTPHTQQIEGYLAWKWGIQNYLPSSHPYREVRP